uniref:Ig-like domain-containing protein n=1 Tax=Maylandia zebra TaxID=106582 RepID=A0A3P9DSY2_9CICH
MWILSQVEVGSQSVILPCKTKPNIPEATRVEWTRSDLGLMVVHEYSNQSGQLMTQDEVYRDRTKMNEDLLRTGDLSLTLKQPTERDTGRYICTIYRDKDILRWKVSVSYYTTHNADGQQVSSGGSLTVAHTNLFQKLKELRVTNS